MATIESNIHIKLCIMTNDAMKILLHEIKMKKKVVKIWI